jgi:hypothetical protein
MLFAAFFSPAESTGESHTCCVPFAGNPVQVLPAFAGTDHGGSGRGSRHDCDVVSKCIQDAAVTTRDSRMRKSTENREFTAKFRKFLQVAEGRAGGDGINRKAASNRSCGAGRNVEQVGR